MKTLIVYSSKYGGTEKIAKILRAEITTAVDTIDLSSSIDIDLDNYENIYIGTPIYAGRARKNIRKFCKNNLSKLQVKNTGIFINCWYKEKLDEYIQNSFQTELIENAEIIYAGIDSNPSEMSWLDRMVVKVVAKMKEAVSDIKHENLRQLVRKVAKE